MREPGYDSLLNRSSVTLKGSETSGARHDDERRAAAAPTSGAARPRGATRGSERPAGPSRWRRTAARRFSSLAGGVSGVTVRTTAAGRQEAVDRQAERGPAGVDGLSRARRRPCAGRRSRRSRRSAGSRRAATTSERWFGPSAPVSICAASALGRGRVDAERDHAEVHVAALGVARHEPAVLRRHRRLQGEVRARARRSPRARTTRRPRRAAGSPRPRARGRCPAPRSAARWPGPRRALLEDDREAPVGLGGRAR